MPSKDNEYEAMFFDCKHVGIRVKLWYAIRSFTKYVTIYFVKLLMKLNFELFFCFQRA